MSADKILPGKPKPEASESEAQQLRAEVDELKSLLDKMEKGIWKQDYSPSNVRRIIEDELTSSGMYKLGRWVVVAFISLGAIVWFGGTIYSGIKIDSMERRAKQAISDLDTRAETAATNLEARAKAGEQELNRLDASIGSLSARLASIEQDKLAEVNRTKSEVITSMTDSQADVSSAAREAKSAFDDRKITVSDEARSAADAIIALKESSITRIQQNANNSVEQIKKEEERALALLNLDRLPDLREIKADIASLERAGGELSLANIRQLAHWSWWVLFVGTSLLTVFGAFSWYRARQLYRKLAATV